MAEIVVLITASSEEEAQNISRVLVGENLAACVNIIPKVRSIFQWEEKVTEEHECLLILKSVTDVFDSLVAKVKAHHSYSVPEVIALPILKGSADYLAWVREVIQPAST